MNNIDSLEGFAQRLDRKVDHLKGLQKQDRELMGKLTKQVSGLKTRIKARSFEIANTISRAETTRDRIDAQDLNALGMQAGE